MGQNQLVDKLKQATLFSRLDQLSLVDLGHIARMRRADPEEVLFAAGERATGFFVLLEGKVKLYKISTDGKEYILRVVRAGETFAEAAAFSGLGYPVFAEALEPCRLAHFETSEFRRLIQRSPQLALNMIATMAELLHTLTVKIEDLSLREVGARLCRHFLELAQQEFGTPEDGQTLKLETTKTALAARLGTISETLSRTFRKLQQHGLLRVERNRVTLLDCRRLRDVAEGELKL
jgi:CRP/FNR family transcriptional regulator, dissimilatory nitrate respiration regulator